MKKLIFTTILTLSTAVLVSSVWAATLVSFSPSSVNVTQGQTFNVTVTLNPQGVKSYTTKLELKYPINLLEAKSFTFGSNSSWIPLSQPGYDLIDNTNGVLIKSAGYPGGVSSPIIFGTVSFLAKSSGNGLIELGNNSFVLDSINQNVLGGAKAKTTVVVSSKLVAQVAMPKPTLKPLPTPTPEAGEVEEEEAVAFEQEQGFNLFAAIGEILTLSTGKAWIAVLLIVAILGLVYYLVNYFRRKKPQK